jgi:branched-chain amino acid transport system permease protein
VSEAAESMQILAQLVLGGIVLGAVYALVAFGYQLTFAASDTLDFGQGAALMLGALVGGSLVVAGLSYWLALLLACLCGAMQGALVERIAVRPALRGKSESGWILSTLALGLVFRNVAENLWGRDDHRVPAPLPEVPMQVLGASLLPMDLLIVAGAVLMMAAIEIFHRKTLSGRAAVATFNDRETASLMGIDTGWVVSGAYMLASLAGAFAGMLVAPLTMAGPAMGAALALKGFAVALIGGLTSAPAILLSGMLLGMIETFTGFFLSTGYKDVPALALLLMLLAVRPAGLFGKPVTPAL